jgi:hypothetical protein
LKKSPSPLTTPGRYGQGDRLRRVHCTCETRQRISAAPVLLCGAKAPRQFFRVSTLWHGKFPLPCLGCRFPLYRSNIYKGRAMGSMPLGAKSVVLTPKQCSTNVSTRFALKYVDAAAAPPPPIYQTTIFVRSASNIARISHHRKPHNTKEKPLRLSVFASNQSSPGPPGIPDCQTTPVPFPNTPHSQILL